MKQLTFWFDPISPFAYLAFERLPQALEGLSVDVRYQPLLFAGLLKHWGQKGPAEIEPKRAWTFRHVHWIAHQHGIAMQTPAQHPFNPLALLRLVVASVPVGGAPNRRVVELAMRHVWARDGGDPNEPEALRLLADAIAPVRDPAGAEVKAELQARTTQAAEAGVFGVPSFRLDDGTLFWGTDSMAMLADAMRRRQAD